MSKKRQKTPKKRENKKGIALFNNHKRKYKASAEDKLFMFRNHGDKEKF